MKYQYNLSIYWVKIGEKVSTNVTHIAINLPIDPILCKLRLTSNNVRDFEDRAKSLTTFEIN